MFKAIKDFLFGKSMPLPLTQYISPVELANAAPYKVEPLVPPQVAEPVKQLKAAPAKKPVAKKPAAMKPVAKKPVAKKPAAVLDKKTVSRRPKAT